MDSKKRVVGVSGGKARTQTRGRQVDPVSAAQIAALLGDRPRRRDELIEYFHLVQDKFNQLSAEHLAAIADDLNIPLAEVFEVATFYAHWDIVKEGETPPPPLTVRVCDSLTCQLYDSESLLKQLSESVGNEVRILRGPCMGRCEGAPVACVGHNHLTKCTLKNLTAAINTGATTEPLPTYIDFDEYVANGGYTILNSCKEGTRTASSVIQIIENSGLRGLGGAGFPTGKKWSFVLQEPQPRIMAVNADEGEPGTFKDRFYMESDPHRFLEGSLIAAWAVEAESIYIYLRDEYPAIRRLLTVEIDRLKAEGLLEKTPIFLRRGAGAYICGEESAMLESLEGKRGLPRHKPPFPSQVGLFGRPTLINNVETLYWVRDIVEKGAKWFSDQGRGTHQGPHSFSVSGRVKEPGVKVAPAGITARELINDYCGGMADGHHFKAYLPGGASGGILPASMADLPLDFGTLEQHGAFIGSAAVVILSDQDNTASAALNLLKFFEDESCGQCTPCRIGTQKAVDLMQKKKWDKELLSELGRCLADASICGLGQAAPNPINHVIAHFPEDTE